MKIELPYFEEINLSEDYFETTYINKKGKEISLVIDFEGEEVADFDFNSIRKFLNNIENKLEEIWKNLLKSDYFTKEVNEYAEHHLVELETELKKQNINSIKDFINTMYPTCINIFPTDEERYFSIDYTINEELTNYVLVVDLFEDTSIYYITTES